MLVCLELTCPCKGDKEFTRRIEGPSAGARTSVSMIGFDGLFECEYRGYARGVRRHLVAHFLRRCCRRLKV